MRKVLAVLVSGLGLIGAAPPLPDFEFRGIKAGVEVDITKMKGCTFSRNVFNCTTLGGEIAGQQIEAITFSFADQKLSMMLAVLPKAAFSDIVRAFTAKYGPACESTSETWANAAGAKFDNPTVRWCFGTGKLEARQLGSRLTEMQIVYADDNQPRPERPLIDF